MSILEIKNIKIYYKTLQGYAKAVDGVSFEIKEGEYLGLVGESGCGKSTIAKAILRILPNNGTVVSGDILLKNRSLNSLTDREFKEIQWKEISMIPQSAMHSFDPVYRIGDQLIEAIRYHKKCSRAEEQNKIEELFALVGLDKSRLSNYSHQFSGGMRQRAMIAMALVLNPIFIVADEPTTGLDVIVQDQIIYRIKKIHEELNNAMLLITHNMALVSENCDKIAVMYAGKIVEYGGGDVFSNSYHPYTLGLMNAFPRIEGAYSELISIPGFPPNLLNPPKGCRFHERCPFMSQRCIEEEPALQKINEEHFSACHFPDQVKKFQELAQLPGTWKTRINSLAVAR